MACAFTTLDAERLAIFYFLIIAVFSQIILVDGDLVMDADILTIKEVAEYLKLTEKTAYRLAAEGKILGFKVGGSWRFRQDEIEKLTKGESLAGESNS